MLRSENLLESPGHEGLLFLLSVRWKRGQTRQGQCNPGDVVQFLLVRILIRHKDKCAAKPMWQLWAFPMFLWLAEGKGTCSGRSQEAMSLGWRSALRWPFYESTSNVDSRPWRHILTLERAFAHESGIHKYWHLPARNT